MKNGLYILLVLFLAFRSVGQDIHFSQFDYNPVFQNPGNIGLFNSDVRFHFNHKDQWRKVTVPFQTTSVSGEFRLLKNRNIAIGATLFHDVVGDGNLRTVEFTPAVSYAFKISKDSTHNIRPGLQLGFNSRQLNFDNFYFDNQFNGATFDPNLPTGEILVNDTKNNITVGTGVVYEWYKEDRKKITMGLAAFNLNRPNQGFYGSKVKRDIRLNYFARGLFKLNFDWDIIPSMQLNLQGKYRELILGSQARYILNKRNGEYMALIMGAYLRNKDSGYFLGGLEWNNWWGGISYDINISQLSVASRGRGGLEISLRYMMKRFKPKKVVHRICPDFI